MGYWIVLGGRGGWIIDLVNKRAVEMSGATYWSHLRDFIDKYLTADALRLQADNKSIYDNITRELFELEQKQQALTDIQQRAKVLGDRVIWKNLEEAERAT